MTPSLKNAIHTCPICGADTPTLKPVGKLARGSYYRDCPNKDDERHALVLRAWKHGLVGRYMGESSENAEERLRVAEQGIGFRRWLERIASK